MANWLLVNLVRRWAGDRIAPLHGVIGAIQASFGGGNALAGGLAGMSSEAFSQMVDTYLSNNTQLDRNERGAITQWAAALSGSAVGGVIGGTTGAQSGAAVSLDAERYNRQLHPDEVARIQQLSGGDKDKEARLKAAACALVKCSAEFAEGSADYVKAQALEQLGNSDAYASERTLLASQSGNQLIYAMGSYASASLPMFGYSVSDQTGDALSRYGVGTRLGGLAQTTGGELQALGGIAMCTTGVACLAGSYLAASGIDTVNAGANSFLSGISQKTSGAYLLEGLGVSPEYSEGIYGLTQIGASGLEARTGVLSGTTKVDAGNLIDGAGTGDVYQAKIKIGYNPEGSYINQTSHFSGGSNLCGPTSCAMIISDNNGNLVNLDSVVKQFNNIRPTGVNANEIGAVLSKNGIENTATTSLTPNQLKELGSNNIPSIVAITAGGQGHFIVVDSYKQIDGVGYYMIRDPYNGSAGIRADFLYSKMTGNGVTLK